MASWLTTAYYDVACTASYPPFATISAGFEAGQEEYWSQGGNPSNKATKTLVLEVLETLDDAMQQDTRYRVLVPHPAFAIGYIAGYVHAYLAATTYSDRYSLLPPSRHSYELPTRQWLTTTYRDIALEMEDTETIESAFEEGQNFWYSERHDGKTFSSEREIVFQMLAMFDEAMRADLSLSLLASPNWAVGFLAGYIQTYVEEQQQQTEPLRLAQEA